ncbi:MAG: PAS domain S-box protein [Desulfobacterales bacterium]|nr:PAS domain S-box protein [Desulfobacterales bacterium]
MVKLNLRGLNIAILGGRYPCKDILALLLNDDLKDLGCSVLGVADTMTEAEGVEYAKKRNLFTTTDYNDIFRLENLDLILRITPGESLTDIIENARPFNAKMVNIDNYNAMSLICQLRVEQEKIKIKKKIRSGKVSTDRLVDLIDQLAENITDSVEERVRYFEDKTRHHISMKKELNQIIHGSMIPTFVINNEHIITHWNRACEKLTGVESDQMVGTDRHWSPFRKSKRPTMADVIVNGMNEDQIQAYYGDCWKKSVLVPEAYEAEEFFPHLGENGKWIYFLAAPIKSDDGKIIGAIETLKDSTKDKEAQAELEAQHKKIIHMHDQYKILFNNNPDPIFIVNTENLEIIDTNNSVEKDYGYSRETLIGKPFFEIINALAVDISYTPEMARQFEQQTEKGFQAGNIPWKELTFKKKDGTHVPVRYSTSYLHKKGNLVGCAFFFHNLTEIKKLEKDLVQSEKLAAIGQTISGLAHYIKNILVGLKGGRYVMDIGLKNENTSKLKDGWHTIKNNIDRTSDLVQDLLTYSKEREPVLKNCRPNEIMEDVIHLIKENAKKQDITIVKQLDPDIGEVAMDPQTIHRSLLNLVLNSIDALLNLDDTDRVMTIHMISRLKSKNRICFEVRDNGVGMNDTEKENVFTPFYSTKGSKGTGLGLMVTAKLVEEHKGTIHVESEQDRGSCFIITLPYHDADTGNGG